VSALATAAESYCARRGSGELVLSRVAGRSAVTRSEAHSPLRLLTPRNAGPAAWAFTSSFGGGMLAGDDIALNVKVETGATAYVSSQSSTRVYRSENGRISRQTTMSEVEADAALILMPEPVVCFAAARYQQRQRFDVAPTGGLVLLDWFTSGRHGRGERWEADHFASTNEVWMDGQRVLRDVLRLDRSTTDRPMVGMGVFNCFATLVLVGRRMETLARELLAWVNALPVRPGDLLPIGASPLAGGAIFRIAGVSIEEVGRVLYERLAFLGESEFLGELPWRRKW